MSNATGQLGGGDLTREFRGREVTSCGATPWAINRIECIEGKRGRTEKRAEEWDGEASLLLASKCCAGTHSVLDARNIGRWRPTVGGLEIEANGRRPRQ